MRSFLSELSENTRLRASSLGEPGTRWMAELDETIVALEDHWNMTVNMVLPGGSESLVAESVLENCAIAILKIGLPGSADLACEAEVYRLADGRGYAELKGHHGPLNALLLERLDGPLRNRNLSIDGQIRVLCETLDTAWVSVDASCSLMTGAEKAVWLANFISERWAMLDQPCDRETRDLALAFADERAAAHSPENAVLVHGDAHSDNALVLDASVGDAELRCKFVDPDGLFAEKACDLAVPMRDWSDELLAGDAVQLGRARCDLLAELTGVDERAIWQWGFIERVSTGLVMVEIGLAEEGAESLAAADRLRRA